MKNILDPELLKIFKELEAAACNSTFGLILTLSCCHATVLPTWSGKSGTKRCQSISHLGKSGKLYQIVDTEAKGSREAKQKGFIPQQFGYRWGRYVLLIFWLYSANFIKFLHILIIFDLSLLHRPTSVVPAV